MSQAFLIDLSWAGIGMISTAEASMSLATQIPIDRTMGVSHDNAHEKKDKVMVDDNVQSLRNSPFASVPDGTLFCPICNPSHRANELSP